MTEEKPLRPEYMRRNAMITNLSTGVVERFSGVSRAKRASHKIQMDNDGALGRGILRKYQG